MLVLKRSNLEAEQIKLRSMFPSRNLLGYGPISSCNSTGYTDSNISLSATVDGLLICTWKSCLVGGIWTYIVSLFTLSLRAIFSEFLMTTLCSFDNDILNQRITSFQTRPSTQCGDTSH